MLRRLTQRNGNLRRADPPEFSSTLSALCDIFNRRLIRRVASLFCDMRWPEFPRIDESNRPVEAGLRAELTSMLPGFRFLLAAIALSVAIPVFGLGVASLFHAAQQDFAGNVAWHSPPETRWTQPMPAPVVAMLRVDPPAARTIPSDIPSSPASALGDNPVDSAAAQPVLAASAGSDSASSSSSGSGTPVSNELTSDNAASGPAAAPPESKTETTPPLAANPTAVATETVQASPAPSAESEVAKPLQTAEAKGTPASGTTGPVSDTDRQAPVAVAALMPSSVSMAASVPVATKAAANTKPTAARKPARAKRIVRRQRRAVQAQAATPAVQPQPFQQASDPFAQPFAQPAAGRRLR